MGKQVSTFQFTGKVGNAVGFKRTASKKAGSVFVRDKAEKYKNPMTNAQLYQRAVAATITRAYAAMKEICDHSFEGKARGAASMQYFNAINMSLLRSRILSDINNELQPEEQVGVVVAPKTTFCTPGPYKISEGSLTQNVFGLAVNDNEIEAQIVQSSVSGQTVAQYLDARGIVADDIFTIVGLGVIEATGAFASQYGQLASQPSTAFGFIRLKVKASALSSTAEWASAKLTDIFDVTFGGTAHIADPSSSPASEAITITDVTGHATGFMGIIRSRNNSKLRSTCILETAGTTETSLVSAYGIKSDYLLNAWIKEADTLGQSRLILEGGNF